MSFAALRLPEHLRRASALAEKYRPEGYLADFDADTLWYDAIWEAGVLRLVCPPLNNLRKMVRRARFRGDGVPLRLMRIRRYKRHEIIEIKAPAALTSISVYLGDWRGESGVHIAEPGRFAGQNVAFYVSRNNDLRWIEDHARFHRHHHGLDAVIVMDNGSETYGLEDIEAALTRAGVVPVVMAAPFKYGPVGLPPYRRMEKYMQSALFNVLRLRMLRGCRAVLSVDVDELVVTKGASVFDIARSARGRMGFVQIKGRWREPKQGAEGPFVHGDHGYRAAGEDHCPPKWCMAGGSAFFRWAWDVHGIERLPFLHGRTHPDLWFAHCRGVTTGWKKAKRLQALEQTVADEELQVALEEAGLMQIRSNRSAVPRGGA